jgi:hypothetical protein
VEAKLIAGVCILAVLFIVAEADAQTASPVSRWDIAASTGVFVGHPSDAGDVETFDDWYHSATLGVTVGRYLSPNLKVESELTISGEGSRYGQRVIQVPGVGPYPVSAEYLTRTNSVSGALVWQFFENQWVHPFVFAGAAVDFDRRGFHTWQSYFRADPRVPGSEILASGEQTESLGTVRRVRGLIGGGAKLYVGPRAFFRADTRIGIGSADSGHVAFRLGFGVDF